MKAMRFVVVDPKRGPIKETLANSRTAAWRKYIESPYFKKELFEDAVRECVKSGFKVEFDL